MKTRVRDIASRAGVSPATVSNALNGRPGVSQEVTDRIRRLAQEMDYTLPKGRAEADRNYIRLIVYKSHGLVVMDTPFFAELIESIQRECQQAGLELVVNHMENKISYLEQEVEFLKKTRQADLEAQRLWESKHRRK